jgi:hypothetical protein
VHSGVAQKAVTGDARVYADAKAAPRPAPADATYHSIYTGIEHQQAYHTPDPTKRDGEWTQPAPPWTYNNDVPIAHL